MHAGQMMHAETVVDTRTGLLERGECWFFLDEGLVNRELLFD